MTGTGRMGDLSKNFSRNEFACKCGCGQDDVDTELLNHLDTIREHFDARVDISSGNRCATHNEAVGGVSSSFHLRGRAADITVLGIPPSVVAELARQLGISGVGDYETFTHVDSRSNGLARW